MWELRAADPLVGAVEVASSLRELKLDELVSSLGCEILYYSDEAFLGKGHESYFE